MEEVQYKRQLSTYCWENLRNHEIMDYFTRWKYSACLNMCKMGIIMKLLKEWLTVHAHSSCMKESYLTLSQQRGTPSYEIDNCQGNLVDASPFVASRIVTVKPEMHRHYSSYLPSPTSELQPINQSEYEGTSQGE